jgi:type IV pilus assembly protein PilE
MAIVGIVSAFAYPVYRDHVTRGALTDAVTGLSTIAAQMERHYQDHRTYESVVDVDAPCRGDVGPRTFGPFRVSCSAAPGALDATSYTLRTEGSGPMSGFVFTLDHRGARTTHAAPSGWNTCSTRWLLKRGESC